MGKIDHKKLRNELSKRTERYAESVRELYDVALADISKILSDIDYNQSEPFSFESYGKFSKVDEIMTKLEQNVQSVIDSAILNEFKQAYSDCDKVIAEAIGENVSRNVMKAFAPKIASNVASKTFAKEIAKGNITASQRVWNGAVLGQMETAVQESLFEGTSARRMATKLQQFLTDPDSCFRRFRISTGVDTDGKNAYGRKWKKRVRHSDGSITWKDADPKDYPTGQGIYHSSYKNAFRYARTTTNIAYRTADYNRYQELAFIIGIEIRLSNNPAHISDICDELKGKYPKDFKWTGWHPNCMCYQVPILAKQADLDKMVDSILDGEDPENVEVDNKIEDMPENFVEWLKSNKSRFELADKNSTLPYFLRDNEWITKEVFEMNSIVTNTVAWKLYRKIYRDDNYIKVEYNNDTGGMQATHINHNFDHLKGAYEKMVQNIGFESGYSVILQSEIGKDMGFSYVDGLWNGVPFEIAGAETGTSNNIKKALNHCASKIGCRIAVVYLPNENYSKENIRSGISRYLGMKGKDIGGFRDFEYIYIINKNKILDIIK